MLGLVYTRLLLGDIILSRDTSRMVFPMKVFFVESVRAGELPLWYPYEALGTPFLGAAVTAVFHPLTWLALPLGPLGGHAVATLLTIVIVSGGAWMLTRQVGGDRLAASVAVVVAMGGGSSISMLDNQTFAWGASAFPWFLYGVHRSQEEHGGPGIAWAGAAVAWALLAGDVQAVVIMAVFGLPAALVWGAPGRTRPVFRLALSGLVGAGLAAVQLFASVPVFLASARSNGVPAGQSVIWSMHPLRLLELVLGNILEHDPFSGTAMVEFLGLGDRSPWTLSVYLGPLTMIAIWMALRADTRVRRTTMLLAGLAVLGLWLALGRYGGLWSLFREIVPMWNGFRYPEKLLPFVQLLLAPLMGLGLSRAMRMPAQGTRAGLLTSILLALTACVLHVSSQLCEGACTSWLSMAAAAAWRTAALSVLLGLLLALRARGFLPGARLIGAILVLLIAADLAAQHGRLVTVMSGPPDALLVRSPVATKLLEEMEPGPGAYRTTTYSNRQVGFLPKGLDEPGFLGVTLWDRAALQPDHNALFHLPATTYYLPGIDSRVLGVIAGGAWNELLHHAPTFSSRYFVFTRDTVQRGIRPELVMHEWKALGISLLERTDALPRFYLARPEAVPDGEAAHTGLARPDVREGKVVLIESSRALLGGTDNGGQGEVTVTSYEPRRLEVVVEAPEATALVHTDAWSPDWVCRMDDMPTQVFRANYLVRALEVPPGRHHIVCEMPTPAAVWIGSTLSLLTAAGLPLAFGRRRFPSLRRQLGAA